VQKEGSGGKEKEKEEEGKPSRKHLVVTNGQRVHISIVPIQSFDASEGLEIPNSNSVIK
jgi:hypothetical protein